DKKNKLTIIKNIDNLKNTNYFSYFVSSKPKIFIPLNINLVFLKCKKIHFLHHKKFNIFEIEFKAKVVDSVLKIKKLQINSSLLKI
ncbi:hypothetical protein OFM39_32235, partial [Escherichia coli]|nr:hypothetical protein [Escherichia coli]